MKKNKQYMSAQCSVLILSSILSGSEFLVLSGGGNGGWGLNTKMHSGNEQVCEPAAFFFSVLSMY
jgi:hypothetical protein